MRILVWDAPNMDMALSEIYGCFPLLGQRPNLEKLMHWYAKRCEDEKFEACVFVNISVSNGSNPKFHGWLRYLSTNGFTVFAKSKEKDGLGDIDDDMLSYISKYIDSNLSEVIIASHDAKCFAAISGELVARKIRVIILGFSELVNGYNLSEQIQFLDLEAIPLVFSEPLPRHINIWQLSLEGQFFPPSGKPRTQGRTQIPMKKRVYPRKSIEAMSKLSSMSDDVVLPAGPDTPNDTMH